MIDDIFSKRSNRSSTFSMVGSLSHFPVVVACATQILNSRIKKS